MLVYRIALAHRCKSLSASGYPGRWNSKGKFVIYTAATRALACLENVVHRSGEGLILDFKVMEIEISDTIKVIEIPLDQLPIEWHAFQKMVHSQTLGNRWIESMESAVLKVPSAIIPNEVNYLLNPAHPDFKRIKIVSVTDFIFDPRIKN